MGRLRQADRASRRGAFNRRQCGEPVVISDSGHGARADLGESRQVFVNFVVIGSLPRKCHGYCLGH
jgi:hypothetical protein